jgi:hypothetical protein
MQGRKNSERGELLWGNSYRITGFGLPSSCFLSGCILQEWAVEGMAEDISMVVGMKKRSVKRLAVISIDCLPD